MSLIISHFPDDWHFYEENLQNYTKDGRTAIANALKELEDTSYLYREQLRKKGRFSNKIWIFNDEGLSHSDINILCPECRKTEIGNFDIVRATTTNTHSTDIQEYKKKNTQKKGRKKKYYDYVNLLKKESLKYPHFTILYDNNYYEFVVKNGLQLLKDKQSQIILSKVQAENLYKRMHKSQDVQIIRGLDDD
jgi:hypothetical protein